MLGSVGSRRCPAGVHLVFGVVITVGRIHRTDESDIVDAVRQLWPPIGNLDTTLAPFLEAHLERENLLINVASFVSADRTKSLAKEWIVLRMRIGSLREGHARVFVQRRFWIEGLEMAVSARKENPDDRLGLRRKVRLRSS